MSEFTYGPVPLGTSYAIHSTRSRHASFTSPEGSRAARLGNPPRLSPFCTFVTNIRCQPTHQAPGPECGVPRGPSPLPVAMLWTESIGPERFPEVPRHDPLSARTGQACIVEDQQHQSALELLAARWSQVSPCLKQGSQSLVVPRGSWNLQNSTRETSPRTHTSAP